MENFKKYINSNFVFILTSISILIISLFYIKIISAHTLITNIKIIYYLMYVVVIGIYVGLFYLIKYMNKVNMKIEKQFLIFGLIFGIAYSILIPMFGVPDEGNHYLRAYEISHGHLISRNINNQVGNYLPENTNDIIIYNVFDIKYSNVLSKLTIKASKNYTYQAFSNTALYSYISYLPQSIGLLIGRILNLPMMIGVYLGRLLNFLTWLFIIYLSIKYIPYGKRIVFMIAFLPMQLQEAISLAPDCLINSLSIGLIAYVLYHMNNKRKLDKKDYLLGSLITILIALLKIVYLPLCLLVLLIPKERFKSAKDKYIKIGILALTCVVVNLIWLKISSGFLITFNEGVDSALQVKGILSNPLNYFVILVRTYKKELFTYIPQMLGAALGWYSIGTSRSMLYIYLLLMIYVSYKEKSVKLNKWSRLLFLFIIIMITLLISTSLYVQWTRVGYPYILGIQGRYFLPVLLLILLLFTRNNKNKELFFKWDYILLAICLINVVSLIALFARQIL